MNAEIALFRLFKIDRIGELFMKYRNASDILPDELIKEIQKYTSGEAIYIPSDKERKKWGSESGARAFYEERNREVRKKYYEGDSIESLSDEYNLSVETIRKIIYS